jgi:hypothetical protein
MEISINTKTRLQVMTGASFSVKLISTFIGQNKEFFFMNVLKKDVLLLCAYRVGKGIFVSREWSIFVRVKCLILVS